MIEAPTNDELAMLAASSLADTPYLLAEPSTYRAHPEHEWICAVIPFDAAVPGRVVLAAPAVVAAHVAADTLRVEPSDEEARAHAGVAMAALASVVAGAVVAEVFKAKGRVRLGHASLLPCEPPLTRGERVSRVTLVNDGGEPMRVELVLGEVA